MEIPILKDIVVVLGLSIVIILLFQKIKVPSLLGFLIAGIIAGPYVFNLISSQHEVELLSEIGIIFLLFIIGIELSLKGLASIKKTILIGGGMQVGGTILLTALISTFLGLPLIQRCFSWISFFLKQYGHCFKIIPGKRRGCFASRESFSCHTYISGYCGGTHDAPHSPAGGKIGQYSGNPGNPSA
jgi:monovalent cation:H+ antiporter-2, CPA2 family